MPLREPEHPATPMLSLRVCQTLYVRAPWQLHWISRVAPRLERLEVAFARQFDNGTKILHRKANWSRQLIGCPSVTGEDDEPCRLTLEDRADAPFGSLEFKSLRALRIIGPRSAFALYALAPSVYETLEELSLSSASDWRHATLTPCKTCVSGETVGEGTTKQDRKCVAGMDVVLACAKLRRLDMVASDMALTALCRGAAKLGHLRALTLVVDTWPSELRDLRVFGETLEELELICRCQLPHIFSTLSELDLLPAALPRLKSFAVACRDEIPLHLGDRLRTRYPSLAHGTTTHISARTPDRHYRDPRGEYGRPSPFRGYTVLVVRAPGCDSAPLAGVKRFDIS